MKKSLKRILACLLVVVMCICGLPIGEVAIKASAANSIGIGDKIVLGIYNGEPISWICADIDENGPLMLSEKVLCNKEFDAPGKDSFYHSDGWGYIRKDSGSNCWSDSNVRQWLNSSGQVNYTHCPPSYKDEAGFMSCFTESELSYIKPVSLVTYVNSYEAQREGYIDGGTKESVDIWEFDNLNNCDYSEFWYQITEDSFFLLNQHQLYSAYSNLPDVVTDSVYHTRIACNAGASYECLQYVNSNALGCCGANSSLGIRPAFYLNVDVTANATGIPDDAVEFNGHYYKFYDVGMTWYEAKEYCESLGGHLVTITSEEENNLIQSFAQQNKCGIIIGFTDELEEGKWKWVTGEDVVYTNWRSGEPNNEWNEDYADIYISGTWNDGHFEREKCCFVCEWDNKTLNGIAFYSNASTTSISVGDSIELDVGYYNNNELDKTANNFIYTISDSDVISVEPKNTFGEAGAEYNVTAKKEGSSTITVTDLKSNESETIEFYVRDPESVTTFLNVPQMTIEPGKVTNYYNYGGMVVDDFDYKIHKDSQGKEDYYIVTMNIYNSKNLYGAVTSYDSKGRISGYRIIERIQPNDTNFVSSVKSLFKSTGDLFHLMENERFYSGESISKESKVEIKVPLNGHIEISNNIVSSQIAMLANMISYGLDFYSCTKSFVKVADQIEKGRKALIEALTESLIKDGIISALKDASSEVLTKGFSWNYNTSEVMINELIEKTQQLGVDFMEKVAEELCSFTGIAETAESVATKVLPTGWIIKLLYAENKALNYVDFLQNFDRSKHLPKGIYIYAPTTTGRYLSNDISVVPENEKTDDKTTVHSYLIYGETRIPNIDEYSSKVSAHYKSTKYSITLYKNGKEAQPDSKVKVSIPIPNDYKINNIVVYRDNGDGTYTNMNASVSNGYAVFETTHFCFFYMIDETVAHNYDLMNTTNPDCITDGINNYICTVCDDTYTETIPATGHIDTDSNGICDNCGKDLTENCTHLCHKGGFVGFIYKIIRVFWKLFKINKTCACGVDHY